MPETYLSVGQDTTYIRHNAIDASRASVLLVHGLGDSGLAFAEIFADPRCEEFNVVVPDLAGHGRSSRCPPEGYSFDLHLDHLSRVIDHFRLHDVTLVGHSLGADLGTLLCWRDLAVTNAGEQGAPKIRRFLNVEGNLTKHDLFISREAQLASRDDRFAEWFQWHYAYRRVFGEWCQRWLFGRRYLASLQFCDPDAFRQNATELYERNRAGAVASTGTLYAELGLDRLFVFGQDSLRRESRWFARGNGLYVHEIAGSHHWPMIDCAEEFYDVLFRFCRGEPCGSKAAKPAKLSRKAPQRTVPHVKVAPAPAYDDPGVRKTLDSVNAPWLIRSARQAQDELLRRRYEHRAIRIADIGCGEAYLADVFAAECRLYHGYEVSPEMVTRARERCAKFPNVEIIAGDARQAKLASDTYDVVWCTYFTGGNLREPRAVLSEYDDLYLRENRYFIDVMRRFFATLAEGGALLLTLYKDTPQAEAAQRSFYARTDQLVLSDVGSRFVATDRGFWSARWSKRRVRAHLEKAGVPRKHVSFVDLNEIAWLVEARK